MPFTLVEVASATDFIDVMECLWISYENPLQSFFRMFCPIRGDGPSARIDSLKESASRMWGEHESDPASYWRKVVDDNGTIVGACLWKIYQTNPFEKPDDHSEIYWHPEGEAREYVSQCLETMEAPREKMGARPQVCKSTTGSMIGPQSLRMKYANAASP